MSGSNLQISQLQGHEINGFLFGELLGQGGSAVVYKAESSLDPGIKRAIKVIRPSLSEQQEFVSRFVEEARLLERLNHPNIVKFFGIRKVSGMLMIELELLEGRSLNQVMFESSGRRANLGMLVSWFQQAALGVGLAHKHGIIHRDLKPENLYLCEQLNLSNEREELVKVLDFGIAKAVDDTERVVKHTQHGMVNGSPAYMAPEMCEGRAASQQTDVYALGMSMFEMLLGYHPFSPPGQPELNTAQFMLAHVRGQLPDLGQVRPDVPAELVRVINKSVELNPADRFPSANALSEALKTAGSGLVIPNQAFDASSNQTHFHMPTLDTSSLDPFSALHVDDSSYTSKPISAKQRKERRSNTLFFIFFALLIGGIGFGGWKGWELYQAKQTRIQAAAEAKRKAEEERKRAEAKAKELTPFEKLNGWVSVKPARKPLTAGLTPEYYVDPSKLKGYRKLPQRKIERAYKKAKAQGLRPKCDVRFPTHSFQIQEHEVTWAELDLWMKDHPEVKLKVSKWAKKIPKDQRAQTPAVDIPWAIAQAFCKAIDPQGDLPTEGQWELAARGETKRRYPWGRATVDLQQVNIYRSTYATLKAIKTSNQDATPGSPKIYDLLGNALEWTRDSYIEDSSCQTPSWMTQAGIRYKTVKGISPASEAPNRFLVEGAAVRSLFAAEFNVSDLETSSFIGFRCVRAVKAKR